MPPISHRLLTAWLALAGLSAAAAVVAVSTGQGVPRGIGGALILLLALFKARVILARYLDLGRAPVWLTGFVWMIGLWAILALGLFLVPLVRV